MLLNKRKVDAKSFQSKGSGKTVQCFVTEENNSLLENNRDKNNLNRFLLKIVREMEGRRLCKKQNKLFTTVFSGHLDITHMT